MNRAIATAPAMESVSKVVSQLNDHERRRYSYRAALSRLVESADDPGHRAGTLEIEISDAIAAALGHSTTGLFVPTQLRSSPERMEQAQRIRAGLDTKTGAAGGYTVQTSVLPDIIDLLRGKSLVISLGAETLSGLIGPVTFAVKTGGVTVSWVGENSGSDVDQTDPTFAQRALVAKTTQATTAYSRKLLAQSSLGIERIIRNELAQAHAEALDIAAIQGLGTAYQPVGILRTANIGDVAGGASGAVPTFANVIALETGIATNNADVGALAYISTPGLRAVLKQTPKAANTAEMIWGMMPGMPGVGEMNGYAAYATSHVPSTLSKGSSSGICHAIIFGDWSSLAIGEWGLLEVLVDPSRLSRQGLVEVSSFQMCDVVLRQPSAFAAMQDAKTS